MLRRIALFALLAAVPSVAAAQQPCTPDARRVVDELYRHMLERAADPGSAAWVARLQSGTTVREIVREIAKSPEHAQRFYNPGEGNVAQERAVATLYRHLLARQPDQAGLRTYTQIAMTQGLAPVVDSIVSSREYDQNLGDWGVPGSGGIRYCGTDRGTSSDRGIDGRDNRGGRGIDSGRDDRGGRGIASGRDDRGDRGIDSGRDDRGGRGIASGRDRGDGNRNGGGFDARTSYREMRFPQLDTNRDGVISRSEWRGSDAAFRVRDWNRDGVLSGEEVRMGAYPPDDSLEAQDYRMTPGDRFDYLDANNDGRITENEWDGSQAAFDRLDRNHDGRISRAELGSVSTPTPFTAIDTNRDGRITLNEWPWSRRTFIQQDENGDGAVTRSEYRGGPEER